MPDTESKLVKRLRRISTPGDLFSEAASTLSRYEAALREIAEFSATEPWRITAKAMQEIARAALENKNE